LNIELRKDAKGNTVWDKSMLIEKIGSYQVNVKNHAIGSRIKPLADALDKKDMVVLNTENGHYQAPITLKWFERLFVGNCNVPCTGATPFVLFGCSFEQAKLIGCILERLWVSKKVNHQWIITGNYNSLFSDFTYTIELNHSYEIMSQTSVGQVEIDINSIADYLNSNESML
jgi:hypothetical protein